MKPTKTHGLIPTHDILDEAKEEAFKILEFVRNRVSE